VCHFTFPRALVVDCVLRRSENWSSDLLLSFRFQARERGPYNKYLFAFLSALSRERIEYVEDFYRREAVARPDPQRSFFHMDLGARTHLVQQRCPHAGGDLERFLQYDEETDTLTCTLHGWRWRRDGTCLTADGHDLYVRPIDEVGSAAAVRRWCADCSLGARPPAVAAVDGAGAG
jgi:nitrite reductase/ring-hydroxylating ferredoxin subunit